MPYPEGLITAIKSDEDSYEVRFEPPIAVDALKRVWWSLSDLKKTYTKLGNYDNQKRTVSTVTHEVPGAFETEADLASYYQFNAEQGDYAYVDPAKLSQGDLFRMPEPMLRLLGHIVDLASVE